MATCDFDLHISSFKSWAIIKRDVKRVLFYITRDVFFNFNTAMMIMITEDIRDFFLYILGDYLNDYSTPMVVWMFYFVTLLLEAMAAVICQVGAYTYFIDNLFGGLPSVIINRTAWLVVYMVMNPTSLTTVMFMIGCSVIVFLNTIGSRRTNLLILFFLGVCMGVIRVVTTDCESYIIYQGICTVKIETIYHCVSILYVVMIFTMVLTSGDGPKNDDDLIET